MTKQEMRDVANHVKEYYDIEGWMSDTFKFFCKKCNSGWSLNKKEAERRVGHELQLLNHAYSHLNVTS